MTTMTISPKRIYEARLAANMSRDDLAYEIRRLSDGRWKTGAAAVTNWEKGDNRPSADIVPLIARATGKPIDFFYAHAGNGSEGESEL